VSEFSVAPVAAGLEPQSMRSRLTKGAGAEVFSQSVNVLIQVGSIPLFLGAWGITRYGEWVALSAVPAYLTMSDFGFGTVSANEMTMLVGTGNRREALRVLQSTWCLLTAGSLLGLAVLTPLVLALPVTGLLHIEHLGHGTAALVLLVLSLYVLAGQQTTLVNAGYRCEGNYGVGGFFNGCIRLFEFLIVAGVVVGGGGPLAAAVGYLAGRTVGTLASRVFLRRYSPWLRFGVKHADFSTVRRLARPALAFMGLPLGDALNLQGTTIMVAAAGGPATLAAFSTIRTLTRFAGQMTGMVNGIVWAEISAAYGARRSHHLRQIYRNACQVSVWLCVGAAVALAAFGPWLLDLWTQNRIQLAPTVFGLLLATMVVRSFWLTSSVVFSATNRHERVALSYAAVNVVALGGAYILTRVFGVNGAAGALLAVEVCMFCLTVSGALGAVADTWSEFLATIARPPVFLLRMLPRVTGR
jgi:O-antigen/teichoic acid export membrane protein